MHTSLWRRARTILARDVRAGARDQLIAYMVIGPLLLAGLARVMLPLIESPRPSFAVSAQVEGSTRAALATLGRVIALPDAAAVEARVREVDDVAGVVLGAQGPTLIIEGNERDGGALARLALSEALRPAHAPSRVVLTSRDEAQAPVRVMVLALTLFCVVLMCGLLLGLTIVEERETGAVAQYGVMPVRAHEVLGARLALIALVSAALLLASVLISDATLSPQGALSLWLAALPVGALMGGLVGAFAPDQLRAVALLKALFLAFTTLPVLGFVLDPPWLYTLSPLPQHWAVQAASHALRGAPQWSCVALAWLTSAPWLVWVALRLRRLYAR